MKVELSELIAKVIQVLQINSKWMIWNLFLAFIPLVLSVWLFRSRRKNLGAWGLGFLALFACIPPNSNYLKSFLKAVISQITKIPSLQLGLFFILGLIPVSIWLFRSRYGRSVLWWLGFVVFYGFLPNAPYLLTDVIHLIDDIRTIQSIWIITLVLFPIYIFVILAGFQAYVISLINLGQYLHRVGKSQWILGVELITHFLSAIGIYWGRFLRFNTWDFITQPDYLLTRGVEELLGKQPLVIMAITFFVLTGLYWLMKRVTLGFVRRANDTMNVRRSISS
ncbi:DUF1361 domain-containing protein [Brunnivagina elsteri]|uniref:DUF1361 domain-containing protein n=1 Tax=Brunnivagina elsteri CCALA 953 TaxID=987040 RepID=A0A2A2TFB7_9CYAN|nr:DUF1361 domain-containing protein [Calothrix elsteri]PAX52432.1 hypothetical protein CK510_19400 [Calothrix elsteri CCALA 953]